MPAMISSTGRWVSGDDFFFDREAEPEVLHARVREDNHVLLTGQRRMGKTSILRELERRFKREGWTIFFIDVERSTSPEDAIADIAGAAFPYRPVMSRFAMNMKRWLTDSVEEISASQFRLRVRAGLDSGNWHRYGEQLLRDCTHQGKPALLEIDELPIFLKRMLQLEGDVTQIDAFLSWLRSMTQILGENSPVLILSGRIGLVAFVRRIGIPDRINHLDPFRVGPWDRNSSVACFARLAECYQLPVEGDIGGAVYDALGVDIPQHVQSFFAHLREYAIMQGRQRLLVEDVREVYVNALLGPSGQSDHVNYEVRLNEALDGESYSLAMEILAEAAVHGVFTPSPQRCLAVLYRELVEDAPGHIADALEMLVHDGCLEAGKGGYGFPSHLLKDWWAARFQGHHVLLEKRLASVSVLENSI